MTEAIKVGSKCLYIPCHEHHILLLAEHITRHLMFFRMNDRHQASYHDIRQIMSFQDSLNQYRLVEMAIENHLEVSLLWVCFYYQRLFGEPLISDRAARYKLLRNVPKWRRLSQEILAGLEDMAKKEKGLMARIILAISANSVKHIFKYFAWKTELVLLDPAAYIHELFSDHFHCPNTKKQRQYYA